MMIYEFCDDAFSILFACVYYRFYCPLSFCLSDCNGTFYAQKYALDVMRNLL